MYTKLDYAMLAVIQKICVTKISIFDTRPNVSQSVTFFKTTEGAIVQLKGKRSNVHCCINMVTSVPSKSPK